MNHDSFSERLARISRLTRKELSEILRDRRTIITLILMPLLLYPLLSVAFKQFFLASGLEAKLQREYRLAFLSEQDGKLFFKHLELGDRMIREDKEPKLIPFAPDEPTIERLEESVRTGNVHVGIVLRDRKAYGRDELLNYDTIFLPDSAVSREVLEYIERRIAAANSAYLESRLGKPGPPVTRLDMSRRELRRTDVGVGISLSALVPLILILMTITGAVYPAIDLTAGERERGTLEILVAAPVPRMGLLFAKYVTVVTVAVLTALVNLVMMTVTISLSGLGPLIFGGGLSLLLIVQLFGLLLLFAAFFSAVLLTLSSFARSFKEAQAYLIPLMLVSLLPGVAGMLPGLKLTGIFTVLPLVNIVLLGRDLFDGTASFPVAVVVVLSTLAYAAAAIAVAARIFGSEGVLYNEQSGWGDLFRRPAESQTQPTVATAMLWYALSFPMLFIIQGLLPAQPSSQVIGQTLGSAVVFMCIPFVVAASRNVHIVSGFRCRSFSLWSLVGAILMAPALFLPIYAILAWMREHDLTLLSRHESSVEELMNQWRQLSPVLLAACLVAVGIVEEWFFRGFLFSALRPVSTPAFTIIASGVLFGFLHFVFAFDRLITSTLLGIVLSWIAYQSGSVFPGMIVHGGYNAVWILMARHGFEPADIGDVTVLWIGSVVSLLVGAGLIYLGRRTNG